MFTTAREVDRCFIFTLLIVTILLGVYIFTSNNNIRIKTNTLERSMGNKMDSITNQINTQKKKLDGMSAPPVPDETLAVEEKLPEPMSSGMFASA